MDVFANTIAARRISRAWTAFRDDENGATVIEYTLIIALIFLAIVSGVRAYTQSANTMYNEIETAVEGA